ncbi:MAG: LPS export ABC transporter periplasmic protein LptC [Salibacteraceae bacterium]
MKQQLLDFLNNKGLITTTLYKTIKLSAALLFAAFTFSCQSESTNISEITGNSDSLKPSEISLNTDILLSDSALLQIKVVTPKLLRFSDIENPYVEFPEGLTLFLYDSLGEIESSLTANYGINYTEEKRVVVKNNVIVNNNRNETLNTEQLTWIRSEKRIFTEEYVKITTPDEIIYGDGLESNESFTKYRIKNIKGVISASSGDEEYDDDL